MPRLLRQHGLSLLVAAAMIAGAWSAYHRWFFIDNFGVMVPEKLYRCRQPRGADWRLLASHDIRTVVNLRPAEENPADFAAEQLACRRAGARLVHIPMPGPLPSDVQFRRFLSVVRESDGAVLLHCEHGRDRAGVLAASYRIAVQGWTVRKTAAEMMRYRGRPTSAQRWSRRMDYLRLVHQTAASGRL